VKRTQLKPGTKALARRCRQRSTTERMLADAWHTTVCHGQPCVKHDCDKPAGPFGHHALRKEWLRRIGLAAHAWDLPLGVPVCHDCHDRHETGVDRITRGELIAARLWDQLVAWARDIDDRYHPGHQPVLSRLERDYPAGPFASTERS
jgi:hypothetical protein